MRKAFFNNDDAAADGEEPHNVTGEPQREPSAPQLYTPQVIWDFIHSEPSELPRRLQFLPLWLWHELWSQISAPLTIDERVELCTFVLGGMGDLDDFGDVPGLTRHMRFAVSAMSKVREETFAAKLPDLAQHRPFQYSPLRTSSSIRLVRFGIAADNNKTITLLLEDVNLDLDAAPPTAYNALSYVWGDHRAPLSQSHHRKRYERRLPVLWGGARIEVTHNLYCFLRRVFFATDGPLRRVRDTPIWVDQLCINQDDIAEKNTQVALMDRVYSQAEQVVSWLGEKDGQTDAAIDLMERLGSWPTSDAESGPGAAARLVRAVPKDDWQSLAGLLSRSYFRRAWIVQEVALARKILVLCGDCVIDWQDLVGTSKLLEETRAWAMLSQYVRVFQPDQDNTNPANAGVSTRFGGQLAALLGAQRAIRGEKPSAEGLLLLGRQFETTVVADKFFAMLGIVRRSTIAQQDQGRDLPRVDYSRDLKQVAMEFAKYHMTKSRNLSLLGLVEDPAHRTKQAEGFPSWLPDPSAPLLPLPLEADVLGVDQSSLFYCWGPSPPLYGASATLQGECLVLQGRRIDTVGPVAEPFNNIAKEDGAWFHIFDFVSHFSSRSEPHLSGMKLGEALLQTLVASSGSPSGTTASLDKEFGDWCISLLSSLRNPDEGLLDGMNKYILAKMYSLDDLIFDIQAFGEGAEDTINSQPLAHEDLPEWYGSIIEVEKKRDDQHRKAKREGLAEKLSHKLRQLWHRDPDDVFPSPERITGTLRMIATKAPQADAIKGKIQHGIDRFEAAVGKTTESRRLFITTGHFLGTGPQSLAPADEVWLAHGANMPLILRRVQGKQTFRLIGEAFVLGIMHGEAVKVPERSLSTDMEIRLE